MNWSVAGGLTTAWLPAGQWYLGDPKFAVPASSWSPLVQQLRYRPVARVGAQDVLGIKTAVGQYRDQQGAVYTVRSGFLGAVPLVLIPNFHAAQQWGRIVTFDAPAACIGRPTSIQIGPYIINLGRA